MSAVTPSTSRAQSYSSFSLGRIWTLATHTVTQLLRMRIMAFLIVFSIIVVLAGFVFPSVSNNPEQQLKLLKDVALGTLQIFSMVIAIAATALLLPRDLEDRTLYTILSKPVPRYEYLIGKLLGVILLLAGGLLIMDLILSAVVWLKQSLLISAELAEYARNKEDTPENIAAVKALYNQYGLTWSLHGGVWAILLKSSVIAAMSLLISCFASTTLFTIITSLAFTIAGHGQQLIREAVFHQLPGAWEKGLSLVLMIFCPDLSHFDLVESAVRGASIPLQTLAFGTGIALIYIVGYTAVAYLFFAEKEL